MQPEPQDNLDPQNPPRTVRPVGRDGHVLNLDFETGDLRDWTPSGNAFDKQPVRARHLRLTILRGTPGVWEFRAYPKTDDTRPRRPSSPRSR